MVRLGQRVCAGSKLAIATDCMVNAGKGTGKICKAQQRGKNKLQDVRAVAVTATTVADDEQGWLLCPSGESPANVELFNCIAKLWFLF
jgi:hypothetical protein